MISFTVDNVAIEQIHLFLLENDEAFVPPLSSSVDLKSYAAKLFENAVIYEASEMGTLIGILAAYRDYSNRRLYVPYICVTKHGLGHRLFDFFLTDNKEYKSVDLEVRKSNITAIKFYTKLGFVPVETSEYKQLLRLDL